MPSQKPRVALTLDKDLNELLDELSKLTKTPKSKIIVGMLRDAEPFLREIISALKLAQDAADSSSDPFTVLARLSALANEQVATINNEMSALYKDKKSD